MPIIDPRAILILGLLIGVAYYAPPTVVALWNLLP